MRMPTECRLAWSERHAERACYLSAELCRVPLPPHPAFGHLLPRGEKGEHPRGEKGASRAVTLRKTRGLARVPLQ